MNTNNPKFDGSHSNTYSRYEPENYTGFKISMFFLGLLIAALIAHFALGII